MESPARKTRVGLPVSSPARRQRLTRVKTEVQFHSTAFNCTEPRDYFINDCCFGDDVARWLIARLRAQGIETTDEPSQEDFGWYFDFEAGGAGHCFIISFQPNDPQTGDRWLGWIERPTRGFFSALLRSGRGREVLPEAVQAMDAALKSSPDIHGVTWEEPGTESSR